MSLYKYCLDHDGLENLGQKIPFSRLKSEICALCKSSCLSFRHNCIREKPEKNKPVNSYKLVENTFSRWSEDAQNQQMIVLGTNSVQVTLHYGSFSRNFYSAAVGKHSWLHKTDACMMGGSSTGHHKDLPQRTHLKKRSMILPQIQCEVQVRTGRRITEIKKV